MGTMIRRADDARLTELARGVVRGDYLIVDDDPCWHGPLMFMTGTITGCRNLGAVLVPIGPHIGGYWINSRVPAVVLQISLVAKGDLPALERKIKTMNDALFPESRLEN